MISEKEFVKKGVERLRWYLENQDQDEVEKYLKSDEVIDLLKERYRDGVEDLKNGEITEQILEHGCVNSAVYCLWMMF